MKIIPALSEIFDQYDAFIIDVWGVIHNGVRPYQGALEVIGNLKSLNKKIVLLTNSPMRAHKVEAQLEYQYNLLKDYYIGVMSSGEATFRFFEAQTKTMKLYVFSARPKFVDTEALSQIPYIEIVEDIKLASHALIAGTGYEKADVTDDLGLLEQGARAGVQLICSNPDLVVQVGDGLYPCPGSWALEYEKFGGDVLYFGKPHAPVYETCFDMLGNPPKDKTLAIGDSLHTDIAGAHNFAIDSLFNIVGIHTEELSCEISGKLDTVKLENLMKDQEHKPKWVMEGLRW